MTARKQQKPRRCKHANHLSRHTVVGNEIEWCRDCGAIHLGLKWVMPKLWNGKGKKR